MENILGKLKHWDFFLKIVEKDYYLMNEYKFIIEKITSMFVEQPGLSIIINEGKFF